MTGGTAPPVRQYKWSLDDPTLATASLVNVGTDNGAGTAMVNPGDGWHTMHVQAVNTAGNTSPVTAFVFGVGVGVTGPANTTRVAEYVRLNGKAPASYGSVTWNYRHASADTWVPVPTANVTNAGTTISSWPVAATTAGNTTTAPELVWDAATTLTKDDTVLLQACYTPTHRDQGHCFGLIGLKRCISNPNPRGSTSSPTWICGSTRCSLRLLIPILRRSS